MCIYVNYLKTVGVNFSLGSGMVNHGTIIALQDKYHLKKHPVKPLSHRGCVFGRSHCVLKKNAELRYARSVVSYSAVTTQ